MSYKVYMFAYQKLRVPMSSALDEGSVILVSSVAHLRDGNRAFKVWNEHSSSVLPSGWGKEIKKIYMVMAFQQFALWQWQIRTQGKKYLMTPIDISTICIIC